MYGVECFILSNQKKGKNNIFLIDCIFMDQAGSGDEFLELGHKWCMGIVHEVTSQYESYNLPVCKGGTNSATGHLDIMVPYPPDFL